MRLDKFISSFSEFSRSDAKKAMHKGEVWVDGEMVKDPGFKVDSDMEVLVYGEPIHPFGERFIMLHKPQDTLCSNLDELYPSVLSLIGLPGAYELKIAGRLDVDTTGLLLLTSDGQWAHRVTSPRRQCAKCYRVTLAEPITEAMVAELERGISLHGEKKPTAPAQVEVLEPCCIRLIIHEGKYHQVKRMLAAVGNRVAGLHREQIGGIALDPALAEGQWRYLRDDEIASI